MPELSKLTAFHVFTREGSFDSVMRDGRILPFDMRKNPREIIGDCRAALEEDFKDPKIGWNPASIAAWSQVIEEYRAYLESIPHWKTLEYEPLHFNCVDAVSGDGEFVFLSFMGVHPWVQGGDLLMFDAMDLVLKGAHVRRISHNMRDHFRSWLFHGKNWSVEHAKRRLLDLYDWRRSRDLEGDRAISYLERMKESKNSGFIEILWKGPLPVEWATGAMKDGKVFVRWGNSLIPFNVETAKKLATYFV